MSKEFTIKDIIDRMDKMKSEISVDIQRLESKFDTLEAGRLSRLEKDLAEVVAQFDPVKKIVYGTVALILVTVLGAILYLIIR